MKFISSALFFIAAAHAATVTVSYDTTYDDASTSLNEVSCSDGPYGLEPRFSTFGSLPNFPYIGGAQAVAGWGSPNCGTCWQLTYTNPSGIAKSINVLAIDHAASGFNIAEAAMNDLTDGQAVFLGRVNAESTQVAASVCGL